jgi:hypothetical protein
MSLSKGRRRVEIHRLAIDAVVIELQRAGYAAKRSGIFISTNAPKPLVLAMERDWLHEYFSEMINE